MAGKDQGNGDGLSTLPLAEAPEEDPTPGDTILMLHPFFDRNYSFIHPTLDEDPVVSMVRRMVPRGWRTRTNEQSKPLKCRNSELSVEDGCILWGNQVVVPPPGRAPVMKMLHEGHPVVSRMKSRLDWILNSKQR